MNGWMGGKRDGEKVERWVERCGRMSVLVKNGERFNCKNRQMNGWVEDEG